MSGFLNRVKAGICAAVTLFTLTAPLGSTVYAATTYSVRDPYFNFSSNYNYYESEHFQFIWGNGGADSSRVTQEFLKGNADNLEVCWDIYINDLGMNPPSQSVNPSLRDGNNYKTNIYISGTGLSGMTDDWAYMAYDNGGYAYMFCAVGAMEYNPASWVLPHEYGHVITAHQYGWNSNKYSYAWWEALANWFREQWIYATGNTVGHGTDFFETYLKNSSLTFPCGRDYYASWPFLIYLTENPDNMADYGENFVRTMLQQGNVDEYPLSQVERLSSADIKETLGNYAKHMATFDFEHKSSYTARLNELLAQGDWNWQQIYTMLEKADGRDGWYTVPTERAPQHAGLNIVPLTVSGSTVSVTLNGLTDINGADWRACIVLEDANGNTTYSDLFKSGETETMNVSSSTAKAYLTVIATPDSGSYVMSGLPYGGDSEFSESRVSFLSKQRYPYEVKIEGATPTERKITASYGSYHSNGGGFVASTANVSASAYVGPDAMVLGYATVSDNAVITDHAIVEGGAKVSGNATISGYAMICENGNVSGNALVSDYALVMGNATVSGNAKVIESALVYGTYSLKDNAIAKGMAFCMYNGSASGQGIVDGDYYDDGGKTISQGTAYGWVSDQAYTSSRPYMDGLYTSYEFGNDSSTIVDDKYTSTYGVSVNAPTWEGTRTSANGVLTLNGTNQYVELDSSLAYFTDTEIQFATLWRGGAADQKVFYFGDGEAYMYFTPSNNSGAAEFVISDGASTQRLTAQESLALGEWSVVRIILNGDNATLMVNGSSCATGTITLDPIDAVGKKATATTSYNFLGRGNDGDYYNGSYDYFNVFFKTVNEPSYYYTATEDIDEPGAVTLWGDANCDGSVDVRDVALAAKYAAGSSVTISDQGLLNIDVKAGNGINVQDVALIAKLAAKLLTQADCPK